MTIYHKSLSGGRWFVFSFFDQMANIGSELERAVNWKEKDKHHFELALERTLELIDLTIKDQRNKFRLKELCRLREVFVDWCFDNQYQSTKESWRNYFYPFIIASRKQK